MFLPGRMAWVRHKDGCWMRDTEDKVLKKNPEVEGEKNGFWWEEKKGTGCFEMSSGGIGGGGYVWSWMEMRPTLLGKKGWKFIAKSWVYLAKDAYNAVSNRWALVSFCRKWRSSQCYQRSWGSGIRKGRKGSLTWMLCMTRDAQGKTSELE